MAIVTEDNPNPVMDTEPWTIFDQLVPKLQRLQQEGIKIREVQLSLQDFELFEKGLKDTGQRVRFRGNPPYCHISVGNGDIKFGQGATPLKTARVLATPPNSIERAYRFNLVHGYVVEIHYNGLLTFRIDGPDGLDYTDGDPNDPDKNGKQEAFTGVGGRIQGQDETGSEGHPVTPGK